jgi:hypothetical protein
MMHSTNSRILWFAHSTTPSDWTIYGTGVPWLCLWLYVFWAFFRGILFVATCTKWLHMLAQLLFSKSHLFFEFFQSFQLVLHFVLIWMACGMVHGALPVLTSFDGCCQWTASVWVHHLQRESSMGSGGSNGLLSSLAFDSAMTIAHGGHSCSIGNHQDD